MRSPANPRTVIAWVVVLAIVLPIFAQSWPVCGDEDMQSNMRCAGLWAAGCCDYSVARSRVQDSDNEANPRPPLVAPVNAVLYQYLAEPECPDRVPIGRAPTAARGRGLSSMVLRL